MMMTISVGREEMALRRRFNSRMDSSESNDLILDLISASMTCRSYSGEFAWPGSIVKRVDEDERCRLFVQHTATFLYVKVIVLSVSRLRRDALAHLQYSL